MKTSDIKTGDVLVCRGKSFLAKLIGRFTGSKFSHVAIAIVKGESLLIVDAQKEGVFPRTAVVWQNKYDYYFEVYRRTQTINDDAYILRVESQYGTPYDKKLLLREFPTEIIKGKLGRRRANIDDKYRGNGKFICSEFAMWTHCYENTEDFSPQDVYEVLNLGINWGKVGQGKFDL